MASQSKPPYDDAHDVLLPWAQRSDQQGHHHHYYHLQTFKKDMAIKQQQGVYSALSLIKDRLLLLLMPEDGYDARCTKEGRAHHRVLLCLAKTCFEPNKCDGR